MKLQVVVIDEPVHVHDEFACDLWRKALWAKEAGYRKEYKGSILPMGADDFFATHLIVAEVLPNGTWEPMVMYKVVRRSQSERFNVPFGAISLLKGTKYENSLALQKVLQDPSEISYDSSWSINPKYKGNKELTKLLRDYLTLFCVNIHLSMGYSRWVTAGVTKFKIDEYLLWSGGKELVPEFDLPIIDNQTVRMFYFPDTRQLPEGPRAVAQRLAKDWENRVEFTPAAARKRTLKVA